MNPVEALLRETQLSMAALARRAGVSRASISEYVHGHRQPRVGQLEKLANAADRRTHVTFPRAWERRKAELEDVLALADALPLRRQAASVPTWKDVTGR